MKDERNEERKEGRWSWKEVGEEGSVEEGGRGKEGVKEKGELHTHMHTHTFWLLSVMQIFSGKYSSECLLQSKVFFHNLQRK